MPQSYVLMFLDSMVKSTPEVRRIILAMDDSGAKPQDIAAAVGLSATQIRRLLPDLRKSRDPYVVKSRLGRPPKLSERDKRRAIREILSGRAPDATALQRDMFPHVAPATVRRMLREAGLVSDRARRSRPCRRKT